MQDGSTFQATLEFSEQQVVSVAAENKVLRELVKSLTEGMNQLSKDNIKKKQC